MITYFRFWEIIQDLLGVYKRRNYRELSRDLGLETEIY